MSPKFEKVRKYYDSGFWSAKMVHNAVKKRWITEEEYEMIVNGSNYDNSHTYI